MLAEPFTDRGKDKVKIRRRDGHNYLRASARLLIMGLTHKDCIKPLCGTKGTALLFYSCSQTL